MAGNVKIRIENLTKKWGQIVGIENLNLEIDRGDFITLLGPSGCGKTTTLRSIAGLEEPTAGRIWLDKTCVFSKADEVVVAPAKRDLGLIFQSYALWPHMTVFNNIAFGLKIKKLPKREIARQVNQILKDVRLDGYAERYPQELSGGQQQRVAIARMLINRPSIFLMDEPLSNLDARLRLEMRSELKELHRNSQATTVYVTHDQEEAMTISSRICVMNEGEIRQIGAPEEVYRKPADLFVAEFISNPKMNFFEGIVEKAGDRTIVSAGGFKLPVDKAVIGDRKAVIAAVRPEDFIVHDSGVEYSVDTQLPAGSSKIVMASRNGVQIALLFEGTFKVSQGDKLKLLVKEGLFNIFDTKTEKRIY